MPLLKKWEGCQPREKSEDLPANTLIIAFGGKATDIYDLTRITVE